MKITLVHAGALGDTVLLMPLLRGLKLKFPECAITIVMRPAFGQMLVLRGLADAWQSADDAAHSRWFGAFDPADQKPGPEWSNADLLISAVASEGDNWALHARAEMTRRGNDKSTKLAFFNPRVPGDFPHHVTEYYFAQLATQGLNIPKPALVPALFNPDGRILIHPGSGGEAKCWPRENYLELADDLVRNGIRPTFILGEAESERWGRSQIKQLQDNYDTVFHVGFFELSEKMSRARVYLGNDSGVSHLAGALGLPSLVLFGPSNDVQWRPLGPQVKIIPAPDRKDLGSLPVDTVLHELMAELRRVSVPH